MKTGRIIKGKRRPMAAHSFIRKYSKVFFMIAAMVSLFVCLTVAVMAAGKSGQKMKTEKTGWVKLEAKEPKQKKMVMQEKKEAERDQVGSMSQNRSAGDVEGFIFYELPKKFKQSDGMLPEAVQVYTFCLCLENNVEFGIVLAVIETESGYKRDAKSSVAYGYMQIVPSCHSERMKRLGVSDILDPYQNIMTGIDYLSEMLIKYDGNYKKALTAYRWGAKGAYRDYFSKGKKSCAYADIVMKRAERIKKQLGGQKK